MAETEDAEEEALVVREKLNKLHKLQEEAANMQQDKSKVVEKAEDAKVMELQEAEKERVNKQASAKLKDFQDIKTVNGNKYERQREIKLKEAGKVKAQDTVKVKESEQAEPMKLKAVVEAVENCVMQQKQNLLKNKNSKGSKPEKRVNRAEVDFDCFFKESTSDADKTSNKLNKRVTIETESEENPEREKARVGEEIKTQEEESLKDEMEVKERRVFDIRDCASSDMVIILDAKNSTKIEVPFSPNSFFTKLSTEAKKICTSLQGEGGMRKERIKNYKGKHSNILQQQVDGSRDQKMDSKGKEEDQGILMGSEENVAEKKTPPLSENQPERLELVAKAATINTSACERDEQRRGEVRSSLGGILLVVLVFWLVLESAVEPSETK